MNAVQMGVLLHISASLAVEQVSGLLFKGAFINGSFESDAVRALLTENTQDVVISIVANRSDSHTVSSCPSRITSPTYAEKSVFSFVIPMSKFGTALRRPSKARKATKVQWNMTRTRLSVHV